MISDGELHQKTKLGWSNKSTIKGSDGFYRSSLSLSMQQPPYLPIENTAQAALAFTVCEKPSFPLRRCP